MPGPTIIEGKVGVVSFLLRLRLRLPLPPLPWPRYLPF